MLYLTFLLLILLQDSFLVELKHVAYVEPNWVLEIEEDLLDQLVLLLFQSSKGILYHHIKVSLEEPYR